MDKKYARAYTEVLELLKHIPKEEFEQIPKSDINFYESNCDKNYRFVYDETKELKNQQISREANAVIVSIYMNYFANDKQKKIMKEILNQNYLDEMQKKVKYDTTDVFKDELSIKNENLPVKINENKSNFFKKILDKFKSFFIHKV